MNYEKKYKEALELARVAAFNGHQSLMEGIFPELKESEDEKIRKDCIKYLDWEYQHCPLDEDKMKIEKCVAWLEKQGEQNFSECAIVETIKEKVIEHFDNHLIIDKCFSIGGLKDDILKIINGVKFEKQGEQNSTNKIESKFKKGDWLVNNERKNIIKVVNPTPLVYEVVDILGYHHTITDTAIENNYHLWTIQDAKNGDVLKEDSCIFIIERMRPNGTAIVHCCLFDDGDFDLGSTLGFDVDSTYPATKEQRDLLFQKMHEARYEWDAEKKKLKKIEQKTAWSEEDQNALEDVREAVVHYWGGDSQDILLYWLKSLKQRIKKEAV